MRNPDSLDGGDSTASQWREDDWDLLADVIVVGTGVAGTAAAVAAARAGASVLVLEKSESVGGTTALSGGAMWIPNNFSLRAEGHKDEQDRMVRYMARSAFPANYVADHPTLGLPHADYELLVTYFEQATKVVDKLIDAKDLEFEGLDIPDYYSDLPEASPWGHAVAPRLPADWQRGGPTGGQLAVEQLLAAAKGLGTKILTNHSVVDVIKNVHDEVVGVQVRRGRQLLLAGARQGVVFATGGFLHNPQLTRNFLPRAVLGGVAAPTSTGDFVGIGARAGAQLSNMSSAWWDQVVVELAIRNSQTARDVFHVYGDAMLMVNSRGKRALNEKSPYSERGQAHFVWDTGRHEHPNRILFMIFDDSVRQSESRGRPVPVGTRTGRFPVPYPDEEVSYLISASTWEGLVTAISERLDTLSPQIGIVALAEDFTSRLKATVDTFNEYAVAGSDPEFLRGETEIEKSWNRGSDSKWPSPSMAPFSARGPYHCILLGAGALDTKGGPRTGPEGQVLDWSGDHIPGLFAAGNCASSISGQAYWGPGATLGQGLTFGYLAGKSAAQEGVRSPALAGTEHL